MSKWFEGILELNNLKDYTYGFDKLEITFDDYKQFQYFSKCLSEYIVFRYVNLDCSSNQLSKKNNKIFKNCFLTSLKLNDDSFTSSFHFSDELINDEYINAMRGIKINKLKNKLNITV